LGTAPIGGLYQAVDDETAHAVVERAWELGLRYFDTAPLYGVGLAESRLGAVLRGKPRGEFAVSTKVGRLLQPCQSVFRGTPPLRPGGLPRGAAARRLLRLLTRCGAALPRGEPRPPRARPRRRGPRPRPGRPLRRGARRLVPRAATAARRRRRARHRRRGESA